MAVQNYLSEVNTLSQLKAIECQYYAIKFFLNKAQNEGFNDLSEAPNIPWLFNAFRNFTNCVTQEEKLFHISGIPRAQQSCAKWAESSTAPFSLKYMWAVRMKRESLVRFAFLSDKKVLPHTI